MRLLAREALSAGETTAYGRLGDGSTTNRSTPVDVYANSSKNTNLSNIVQVSAGNSHTCAVTSTGGVKCWGYNAYGSLGDGSTTSRSTPVDVYANSSKNTNLSNIVQVSVGSSYTCAVTSTGGVKCWGYCQSGQLGNGSSSSGCSRSTPVDVKAVGGSGNLSGIVQVSAGNSHTCAVTSTGGVKCWGYNGNGQVGDGSTTTSSTPVAVYANAQKKALLSDVVHIAAGYYHTCALTNQGKVKCWGSGSNGQLGNGSSSNNSTPLEVTGLNDAVGIFAGGYYTCARTSKGEVKCWGSNGNGQLGNNSTSNRAVPVSVQGSSIDTSALQNIAFLDLGSTHTCAVADDNKALCWGNEGNGRLGNGRGTTGNMTSPTLVYQSSSSTNQLDLGSNFDYYHCAASSCTYYRPTASVSGNTATPTFTASNLQASDIVTIYTSATCDASTKNKSMTVASGQTSASTTLASLGGSDTYKLYFTIQRSGIDLFA